jgi:predicted metal-dependent phosphoesterase TrpH
MTRTKLKRLLTAFKATGGEGLEVVSGAHSKEDNFQMAFLAQQFGLKASKGSDYHGPAHFWIELGRIPDLPTGCTPIWTDF